MDIQNSKFGHKLLNKGHPSQQLKTNYERSFVRMSSTLIETILRFCFSLCRLLIRHIVIVYMHLKLPQTAINYRSQHFLKQFNYFLNELNRFKSNER